MRRRPACGGALVRLVQSCRRLKQGRGSAPSPRHGRIDSVINPAGGRGRQGASATDSGHLIIEGNKQSKVGFLQVHRPLLRDPRVRVFYERDGIISGR